MPRRDPRTKPLVTATAVRKGSRIDCESDGKVTQVPMLFDGLHIQTPGGCFFIDAKTLWEELDKLID